MRPLLTMRPTTAEDLPPELFKTIVDSLVAPTSIADVVRKRFPLDKACKHALGEISLTCRYFATRCRPFIFQVVSLRSRDDILTLRFFIESPLSKIRAYIRRINVQHDQDKPGAPWIHLLQVSLTQSLLRTPHVEVKLADTACSPIQRKLRTIYIGLPRPLPPPTFQIALLTLSNYKLASLRELQRLVVGLPTLRKLFCENLSWGNTLLEAPIPIPPGTLRRCQLRSVTMKRCQEHWLMFWLLTKTAQLQQNDVRIGGCLVQCIQSGLLYDKSSECLFSWVQEARGMQNVSRLSALLD